MRLNVPTQLVAAARWRWCQSAAWATPQPWQMGMQPAATPIMHRVSSFHDLLVWMCVLIVLFVFALLAYACWRFSEKRNPVPSRRSHNTLLEIVWTAVPVLILVIIAIPSFKLLYFMDVVPETELTIKATGHQWYWSYEYPDNGNFTFDAYMIADLGPAAAASCACSRPTTGSWCRSKTNVRIQTTADRRAAQLDRAASSASRSTRCRAG